MNLTTWMVPEGGTRYPLLPRDSKFMTPWREPREFNKDIVFKHLKCWIDSLKYVCITFMLYGGALKKSNFFTVKLFLLEFTVKSAKYWLYRNIFKTSTQNMLETQLGPLPCRGKVRYHQRRCRITRPQVRSCDWGRRFRWRQPLLWNPQ